MITIACIKDNDLYDDYAKTVQEIRKVLIPGYICALEVHPMIDPVPFAIHIWKEGEL